MTTRGSLGWALLAALLAAAPSAAEDGFDPDLYPERAVSDVLAKSPCKPGSDGFELKDIPFSARVPYRKSKRESTKKSLELIRRWALALSAEDQLPLFGREMRLGPKDGGWWVATPKDLLEVAERELREGDNVWFFMSFVGCVGKEPVFAVEEFQLPSYEDLEEEASSYIT